MFSQSLEEFYVIKHFINRPPAKFIDVGAYDIFRFSNTRALYDKLGWGGVLVEPAPKNYSAIAAHYENDPRIEVLNIAVGDVSAEIDFFESDGDAVSTSDVTHMKIWGGAGVQYNKIKVKQMAVQEFMEKYCTPDVEFISIDTEATNYGLFKLIPSFVFKQISMLCIEHDLHYEEIKETLAPYGFEEVYINAENIILAKPYVEPPIEETVVNMME